MKNFRILIMGLLLVGISGLTSCKKEKKIEKNLWSNGGEWNIEKFVSNWGSSSEDSNTLTEYNFGTFLFEKDGGGKLTIDSESNPFNYTNTENSLTITYKEGPMYTEGEKEEYTLDWEKDKIELYSLIVDGNVFDEITMTLKKK